MPHSVSLITTIAAAFGLALILGFVAVRLKLPALVGYLIAGILLGPATPGFVANIELSRQLAEIGVMLLMFGVGLHFSFDDLLAVRRIAVPGAIAQMAVATALGMGDYVLLGWSFGAGIVFGLALSVASTVVVLRTLEDRGVLDSINGRITVGWLVVEDFVMVLVLVLLPSLSAWLGGNASGLTEGTSDRELLKTLGFTLSQVAVFVVLMLVVGRRLFPWILWQVARTGSRESSRYASLRPPSALPTAPPNFLAYPSRSGPFRRDGHERIRSELSGSRRILTVRDAFSVLFFVSVGMLFDPEVLIRQPLRVLAVVGIIVFGNSLAAFLIVLAFRYPLNTALTVSASLAQCSRRRLSVAALWPPRQRNR